MNIAQRMMDAMSYDGNNRLKRAWLMALANYHYSRSFDGEPGMDFGRWPCFCGAAELFWDVLWRKL